MPIAYRKKDRAVFLYGFAKSERGNVEKDELLSLREIGAEWLGADTREIAQALADRTIEAIENGKEEKE